jgi:hypothetical protein
VKSRARIRFVENIAFDDVGSVEAAGKPLRVTCDATNRVANLEQARHHQPADVTGYTLRELSLRAVQTHFLLREKADAFAPALY